MQPALTKTGAGLAALDLCSPITSLKCATRDQPTSCSSEAILLQHMAAKLSGCAPELSQQDAMPCTQGRKGVWKYTRLLGWWAQHSTSRLELLVQHECQGGRALGPSGLAQPGRPHPGRNGHRRVTLQGSTCTAEPEGLRLPTCCPYPGADPVLLLLGVSTPACPTSMWPVRLSGAVQPQWCSTHAGSSN